NFPHRYSFGDLLLKQWQLPTQIFGGFFTMGLIVLFLLFIALVSLYRALNKWQKRSVVSALLILFLLPPITITAYQTIFASGIYGVQYDDAESFCSFEMESEKTLHGECSLPFKNVRNEIVTFELYFEEENESDIQMVSLMNENAPFSIDLQPRETKTVHIEAIIDVTDLDEYVESGTASHIDIVIYDNERYRQL